MTPTDIKIKLLIAASIETNDQIYLSWWLSMLTNMINQIFAHDSVNCMRWLGMEWKK